MAQKIKPTSLRIGIIKNWSSCWFPKKKNSKFLLEEDVLIRNIVREKIGVAGIEKIDIERTGSKCKISITASKPGLIIGRGGKGVEDLTKVLDSEIKKLRKKQKIQDKVSLSLDIRELKRFDISAAIVAQNIAWDLEKRMPFRRIIKKYLEQILQNKNVGGGKIKVAGRLDGAEIARSESLQRGRLPLQTLRVNIDYGQATAFTTYGAIGVKVWINKGEVFGMETDKEN